MIDQDTLALFKQRYKTLTADSKGDDYSHVTRGLTLGLVVNTDDPLEQGRLQVYCPSLNDNPKKVSHLPWSVYITPFGGSINNTNYTRGTGDPNETPHSNGAVHYGFWAVPEMGAHVLIGCIDGDPRRRFWIGSVPEHQETHTMLNGRYDWSADKGTPDGPLTSNKEPIQPIYDNWSEAFDRTSSEWKTRGADYQVTSISAENGGVPNSVKGEAYIDDSFEGIAAAEKDEAVKDILGGHGYDFSGFKSAGAYKASRVFGMSTPGFHAFTMDDRPFNNRMKLRTSTGHQILLDDTNERIYIMTNRGKNFIEMDSNGNIDMYSERRVSIHAAKDLNFTAGETIRLHAGKSVHMYSGAPVSAVDGVQQTPLEFTPAQGEIRIQSEGDFHLLSNANIRQFSKDSTFMESGVDLYELVHGSSFMQTTNEINVRTDNGNYNLSVAADLNETIQKNSKRFSIGNSSVAANKINEVFSFDSVISIGAKNEINMKSTTGSVYIAAVALGGDGNGGVYMKSPESQLAVSGDGLIGSTNKITNLKAAESITFEQGSSVSPQTETDVGPPPELGPCNLDAGTIPVTWNPDNPNSIMSDEMIARAAYKAGFRGNDLLIAVAIAKAESSGKPAATGDVKLQNSKWGPSIGLWQIRTLTSPQNYSGIDRLRVNDGRLKNPNTNAQAARAITTQRRGWRDWSTYTDGKYKTHMAAAKTAVTNMCNSVPSAMSAPGTEFVESFYGVSEINMGNFSIPCIPSISPGSIINITGSGVDLQSLVDVNFKSLSTGISNKMSDMSKAISANIQKTNLLSYYSALTMVATSLENFAAVAQIYALMDVASLVEQLQSLIGGVSLPSLSALMPLLHLDLDIPTCDVPPFQIPPLASVHVDVDVMSLFKSQGYPLTEATTPTPIPPHTGTGPE